MRPFTDEEFEIMISELICIVKFSLLSLQNTKRR